MPKSSPFRIILTVDEERELQATARKYTSPYFSVVRAKIVLLAAAGLPNKEIGERLDMPRRIVSKWRKRFFERGMDGLDDQARPGRPPGFSPSRHRGVKALACARPRERGLPLSRLSHADIARQATARGIVASISGATVWRWLSADAIKPWFHRSWIFPRDPRFAEKAGVVVDLYQRLWQGEPLGPNDFVISADEKTSIQARRRVHADSPPAPGRRRRVEFEYDRGGALAYTAAWDVHRAKVFGLCEKTTGIEAYHRLVDLVMAQEPYASARRVFWITDNGSSHRGAPSIQRLSQWYPNAVQVHTPVHASWLNQIEIYFSVVQRKVLTPNDFDNVDEVEKVLMEFQDYYAQMAKPFRWEFTREKLQGLVTRLSQAGVEQKMAA